MIGQEGVRGGVRDEEERVKRRVMEVTERVRNASSFVKTKKIIKEKAVIMDIHVHLHREMIDNITY